jgi:hypothetical protein
LIGEVVVPDSPGWYFDGVKDNILVYGVLRRKSRSSELAAIPVWGFDVEPAKSIMAVGGNGAEPAARFADGQIPTDHL